MKRLGTKGNLFDGLSAIVILFVVAIAMVLCIILVSKVKSAFNADPNIPSQGNAIINQGDSTLSWVFDFIFIMMLIGLPLVSMVLAFFNNIHPFFFWSSIGITMVIVILAGAFGDSWIALTAGTGDFATAAARMPMSNYVLSNFAIYALFMILVIGGGVYIKTKNEGGYNI